jgi:hypothetical protein
MFDFNLILTASGMLLGGVVWLVRLEGKIMQVERSNQETQKDVDDLRVRHEALDERLMEKLSHIEKSLARIEGHLEGPRA